MKYLGLEIYKFRIQILAAKETKFYLKSASCELQVLIELTFWFIFQFSIFILRESSNGVSRFPCSLRFFRNQQLSLAKSYRSITL